MVTKTKTGEKPVVTNPYKLEGLCPVCGAHLAGWAEVFGEPHYCDPEWVKGKD